MPATYPHATPFADTTTPTPGSLIWRGQTRRVAIMDGIQAFLATNGGPGGLFTPDVYQRFLVCSQSWNGGDQDVRGRHLALWNGMNSTFHASGRRLMGSGQSDYPDFAVMGDTVFMTDSQGRWGIGTAPFAFVYSDDAGVFLDESADAQDNGAGDVQLMPSAAQAINDAFYMGAAVTFQGALITLDRALVIGSGGTATYALEYWNGASWATLTVSLDVTPGSLVGSTPFARLGQHFLSWAIPGDWATTAVNGQTQYWVRIRATGASGSGYVSPTATKVFAVESVAAVTPRVPAAYRMTNDPTTNAEIYGWGIHRLETGATAQVAASIGGAGAPLNGGGDGYYPLPIS